MNTAWLADLPNPQHDGTTQQIYDSCSAYQTENARFLAKLAIVGQCRQTEDDVWLKAQRDPAVKSLESADKEQDGYVTAARYINLGYVALPDAEAQKTEAVECEQIFKDYKFSTRDAYGAEADKIIQMEQNFQPHVSYLTQIGAWQWYQKAVAAAQQVRQALGERAFTMGQAVNGEMKAARRATDVAIADLYTTIEAMNDLMPSAELTALITQLKGIELYARQYIIKDSGKKNSSSSSSSSSSTDSGSTGEGGSSEGGSTETPGSTTDPATGGSSEGGDDNSGGSVPDVNAGFDMG